jgi:hypothetical protein
MDEKQPQTIQVPKLAQPALVSADGASPLWQQAAASDILQNHQPVIQPASGVTWQAKFFKCADRRSRVHWLSWSRVEYLTPDFHWPDCFGSLEFTD